MGNRIRQSQALFPFGVGAILDADGQSFVACDINRWHRYEILREKRLEAHLKVSEFRAPPKVRNEQDTAGVPFFRFPRWLFCPRPGCRRMQYLKTSEETGKRPVCRACRYELTPMRWVMACEAGHLRDVPWDWLAHSGNTGPRCEDQRSALAFGVVDGPSDGSLASLVVSCGRCKAWATLALLDRLAVPCNGLHPWLRPEQAAQCNERSQVKQRGASNLRYDFSTEAIDIPPFSDFDYWGGDAESVRQHPLFNGLVRDSNPGSPWFDITVDKVAEELSLDAGLVTRIVVAETLGDSGEKPSGHSIEFDEFVALTAADKRHEPRDRFQKRTVDIGTFLAGVPSDDINKAAYTGLGEAIEKLAVVTRLRSVRVLRGFSRITRNAENMVPVDLRQGNTNWLPAVEVYGEGIFLAVDAVKLRNWAKKNAEATSGLAGRFAQLSPGLRLSIAGSQRAVATPDFVFLHTLSHLLMLQVQFFSGYSAASVRERIYCGPRDDGEGAMAGILLFTSAGDVEGSMGGLARLGRPENFFPLMISALRAGRRCSSDPVCGGSAGQGLDGLNMAACHACALVPETSCAHRNQLLDRAVVAGSQWRPVSGFLESVARQVDQP